MFSEKRLNEAVMVLEGLASEYDKLAEGDRREP